MVDTWATVGSCAQIGRRVAPLRRRRDRRRARAAAEPPGDRRGRLLHRLARDRGGGRAGRARGAVLGARRRAHASTPIVDVTGSEAGDRRAGRVPPRGRGDPGIAAEARSPQEMLGVPLRARDRRSARRRPIARRRSTRHCASTACRCERALAVRSAAARSGGLGHPSGAALPVSERLHAVVAMGAARDRALRSGAGRGVRRQRPDHPR